MELVLLEKLLRQILQIPKTKLIHNVLKCKLADQNYLHRSSTLTITSPTPLPPTTRSMCGVFYYLFEKGISDTTVNRFLSRARVTSFPRLPALPSTLIQALRKSSYKDNTRPHRLGTREVDPNPTSRDYDHTIL